jgi:hypothetical protein
VPPLLASPKKGDLAKMKCIFIRKYAIQGLINFSEKHQERINIRRSIESNHESLIRTRKYENARPFKLF